jgi:hypothetical protein
MLSFYLFFSLHRPVVSSLAADSDTYPSGGEAANQGVEINRLTFVSSLHAGS